MSYQRLQKYKGSLYGLLEQREMDYDDTQTISNDDGSSHPEGRYSMVSSYSDRPDELENPPHDDFQQTHQRTTDLPRKDNFIPGIELIPLPDTPVMLTAADTSENSIPLANVIKVKNPWTIFISLLILWVAIAYWTYAVEGFVLAQFHGDKPLNWKWLAFYGVIFTIIFAIVAHLTGLSLISAERE